MRWKPSVIEEILAKLPPDLQKSCCDAIAEEVQRLRDGKFTDEEKAFRQKCKKIAQSCANSRTDKIYNFITKHPK